MRKEHQAMLAKYGTLKGYFEIEEGKYIEEGVEMPTHVRDALSIIRGIIR